MYLVVAFFIFFLFFFKSVGKFIIILNIKTASLLLPIVCLSSESNWIVWIYTMTVQSETNFFVFVSWVYKKLLFINKEFCGKYKTVSLIQFTDRIFSSATESISILIFQVIEGNSELLYSAYILTVRVIFIISCIDSDWESSKNFWHETNLIELINFYSPRNHQKITGYLKFGDDPFSQKKKYLCLRLPDRSW